MTKKQTQQTETKAPAQQELAVPKPKPKLSDQLHARGVSNAAWHTLKNSVFPGARDESILLAVDYCKARGLDVLKRPCHIVSMDVLDAASGQYVKREVILPGIYELRTTAHRTEQYLGHTPPEFGPDVQHFETLLAPEYCAMKFRRRVGSEVAEFPVIVFFNEVVGTKDYGKKPNKRWAQAPRQMLVKCTEAAGLREAFPEELGGQYAAEEADSIEHVDAPPVTEPTVQGTGANADEMNQELGIDDNAPPPQVHPEDEPQAHPVDDSELREAGLDEEKPL